MAYPACLPYSISLLYKSFYKLKMASVKVVYIFHFLSIINNKKETIIKNRDVINCK